MTNVKNATRLAVWLPNHLAARLRQASQQTGIQQSVIMRRAIEREITSMQPVIDYMRPVEQDESKDWAEQ